MNHETPGKVIGLLSAAMVSLFLLFAVTVSDASFSGTKTAFPDPFGPDKVMAVLNTDPFGPDKVMAVLNSDPFGAEHVASLLDNAVSGYNRFLAANLFGPAKAQLAYYRDTGRWVIDQAADPILAMTGMTDMASVQYYQDLDRQERDSHIPRVAGAYTERGYQSAGLSINALYSILIR